MEDQMTAVERFPLTSMVAIIFVVVGAIVTLTGGITFEDYLVKTGVALAGLGVVGGVRVLDKFRAEPEVVVLPEYEYLEPDHEVQLEDQVTED